MSVNKESRLSIIKSNEIRISVETLKMHEHDILLVFKFIPHNNSNARYFHNLLAACCFVGWHI